MGSKSEKKESKAPEHSVTTVLMQVNRLNKLDFFEIRQALEH